MKNKRLIFILLAISALVVFVMLAYEVKNGHSFVIDEQAMVVVEKIESQFLTTIVIGFTTLGSKNGVISMFLLSLLLSGLVFKHYAPLLGLTITVVGGDYLNKTLKAFIGRERPSFNEEVGGLGFSFPSGHAMVSCAFYGLVAYLILMQLKKKSHKVILTVLSVFMVLCIGLSRVYLKVHYLTDIIAGFAAGLLLLMTMIVMIEFLMSKKAKKV
jgi:undecaprenyl-diphosphatase